MVLHGDCLEKLKNLPDESVDAVVTDPPYCSGGLTEAQKARSKGMVQKSSIDKKGWFVSDNMTSPGLVYLLRKVALEAFRILKDRSTACFFCDWRMYPLLAPALESAGFRLQNMVVWDKCSIGLGRGFRPQHELIIILAKGTPNYYKTDTGNLLRYKRVNPAKKHHPTEKPVDLLSEIIKTITPPKGTVLDPFCGSGSTLVAAKREGYSYIGIERDEGFVSIARERLNQTQEEVIAM